MKYLRYGLVILLGLLFAAQVYSFVSQTPLFFSFALSNSMEPTIRTGDFFFISPKLIMGSINVGDIVLFKNPRGLQSSPICHRIVGEVEGGYLTRGDNSPFIDQEGNIPIVKDEHIIGRVITLGENPLLIPGLGAMLIRVQYYINQNKIPVALLLLLTGVGLATVSREYKPKINRVKIIRVREKPIFLVCIFLFIIITSSILVMKNRDVDVRYLAATSFTTGNCIKIGDTSDREIVVENSGLIPIYVYIKPLTEGLVARGEEFNHLYYKESYEYQMKLSPQGEPGWRVERASVFLYPALLPSDITLQLAELNPNLPTAVIVCLLTIPFFGIYMSIGTERSYRFKFKTRLGGRTY